MNYIRGLNYYANVPSYDCDTGNVAAVQHQLGHRNVPYQVRYASVSHRELLDALNERS